MNNIIYFDNSATTKPCKSAIDNIDEALNNVWGNPSSLHSIGLDAQMLNDNARAAAAKAIKCSSEEIFFTSGGTEANNLAVIGAALARKKRGNRIITTAAEHPSVLEAFNSLASLGFEVIKLPINGEGIIRTEDLYNAVNDKTILISIMLVNNEIGSIQPVEYAKKVISQKNAPALLHCDAVQAFGKIPISVSKIGADLMSFSGHKIYGPKGVGILYKKKNTHILPLFNGGGQEQNLRSGTEAVPLIHGLAGAIEDIGSIEANLAYVTELNAYARKMIKERLPAVINSPDNALPYILNISLPDYRSETLLHFLNSKRIFVSSGSACAKGATSHVLSEMGLGRKRIDGALRLSFSKHNTKDEIDSFCEAVIAACKILRKA